jgi:hypothetical protein
MTIINRLSDLILLLILLGAIAWVFEPARGDDRLEGLTPAQRAQVADPNNPQFDPPRSPAPAPLPALRDSDKDQTRYVGPDEATKAWALRRAFQLNGNSMVGNNRMIDLTDETPFTNPVKTERVTVTMPKPAPAAEAQLAKMVPVSDVCARHGMHKVTRGSSWRCKR